MVVTGVLVLGRPVTLPRIRRLVQERLLRFRRFRQRVVGRVGLSWEDDPRFSLERQVVLERLPVDAGDAELQALIGALASRPFDDGQPPWRIHVVPRYRGWLGAGGPDRPLHRRRPRARTCPALTGRRRAGGGDPQRPRPARTLVVGDAPGPGGLGPRGASAGRRAPRGAGTTPRPRPGPTNAIQGAPGSEEEAGLVARLPARGLQARGSVHGLDGERRADGRDWPVRSAGTCSNTER